jgi:hypothetical protein
MGVAVEQAASTDEQEGQQMQASEGVSGGDGVDEEMVEKCTHVPTSTRVVILVVHCLARLRL